MRVFLDANILFSAAQEGSPVRQMLDALGEHVVLVSSPYAITEAQRNVTSKRPDWVPGLGELLEGITTESGQAQCGDVLLHEGDRPILAAAVHAKCTHLLTGDFRHFGPLMGRTIHGVTIVSTRMLAGDMVSKGWIRKRP